MAAFSNAFETVGWGWASRVVSFGAMCGILTSLLGAMCVPCRMIMVLAREGFLPKILVRCAFLSIWWIENRKHLGKREWIYIHASVCHCLDRCCLGNDGDALGSAGAHVDHINGHLIRFLPCLYVFHLEKVGQTVSLPQLPSSFSQSHESEAVWISGM